MRAVLAALEVGGNVDFLYLNRWQAALIFACAVCGALACQFGYLLMAMDRRRAEMAHLAVIDDLTGIANRRRFLERAEEECERSLRTGRPFSLMVVDIDHFKLINDTYGHGVGDAFIKLFARTTNLHLRAQDMFARLGGDEFCILMPETNPVQASAMADRLVAAMRRQSLSHQGAAVATTISVGIAEWSPAVGRDVLALVALADRALYRRKQGGRDGVAAAAPAAAPAPAAGDLAA
jgi:diguanylate cyclase (GGDEF)-like protein